MGHWIPALVKTSLPFHCLFIVQLDVLFGNLLEMIEFQVEFLKTLEDGTRLVPDLEKLERVDQFKVTANPATRPTDRKNGARTTEHHVGTLWWTSGDVLCYSTL